MSCHPLIVPRRPTVAPGRARRAGRDVRSCRPLAGRSKACQPRLTPTTAFPPSDQLPITSVPFGGVKLKVPAAKPGLRFQPLKVITVRWPTASVISILARPWALKPSAAYWKLASVSRFGDSDSHCRPSRCAASSLTSYCCSSSAGLISAVSGLFCSSCPARARWPAPSPARTSRLSCRQPRSTARAGARIPSGTGAAPTGPRGRWSILTLPRLSNTCWLNWPSKPFRPLVKVFRSSRAPAQALPAAAQATARAVVARKRRKRKFAEILWARAPGKVVASVPGKDEWAIRATLCRPERASAIQPPEPGSLPYSTCPRKPRRTSRYSARNAG